MKVDKDLGITIAIVLIFFWLVAVSFAIVDLYAYKTLMLEHINNIYDLIAEILDTLTDVLTMGVYI